MALSKLSPDVESRAPALDRSPWDFLRAELPGRGPAFLWEAPGAEEIAGVGAAAWISCAGPARFAEAQRMLTTALVEARDVTDGGPPAHADGSGPGPLAIGGFSFAEQEGDAEWPGFPDALFFIPERMYWRSPGRPTVESRWSVQVDAGPVPSRATSGPGWDRAGWTGGVTRTLDRIRDGSFSKAVLARSVEIDRVKADLASIMDALRTAYPGCYRFLIADGRGNAFLGASPERLVRRSGDEIETEAVAGTIRCEPDDDESAMSSALQKSTKDRSEQRMVLEHLRSALDPVAIRVTAADEPEVMRLPHLLHLRTRVVATARPGAHVLDLVSRLHPTPAVAGWPRPASLDWIQTVEPCGRGWYAGPVGWVNARGDGDFAVGIRSLSIRGERARIFSGAGIVEGSDPDLEWRETELKMKGVLDALAGD